MILTSGERDGLAIAAKKARELANEYTQKANIDEKNDNASVFTTRQRCGAYTLRNFADWCDKEIAKKA